MTLRWMSRIGLTVMTALLCGLVLAVNLPGQAALAKSEKIEKVPIDDGIILGIGAVDKLDDVQLDSTRNIRIFTYIYNNSPVTRVIDWRTRRLHSHKVSAFISDHEFYGEFILKPGEIKFMRSYFYYKTGFPGKFAFSVRDESHNVVYSVPLFPQATNLGPFASLPVPVQHRLIDAFLSDPSFKWWYTKY